MDIYLFPEKKEGGIGRLNDPDTNVAMLMIAPVEDYGELLSALDICSTNVYHQTKYIQRVLKHMWTIYTKELKTYKGPEMLLLYANRDSLMNLAKELDIDPYTTLMDDIEEMRKVRNEIRCVLHMTEPCDCSNPKRLDYMNILPACFTAMIGNTIPRRRLYKVIHDAVLDGEMLEIMNEFSLGFKRVREDNE